MNIYKHDLKTNIKPFIFWTIGLAFLIIVGMTKFLGFSGSSGSEMTAILDKIPKVVMMVFGMADVDILSVGGFYSVLENYVIICTIIYAIILGSNAVARESIDKTYEFIFTKPRTRFNIISTKILASFTYLIVFCILNVFISFTAFSVLDINNTIGKEMILFAIANTLVGILFFTLSIFLAATAKKSEKGISISFKIFLITYIGSIFYDVFEWPSFIKVLIPFKYFGAVDLLASKIDIVFVALSLVLSGVFLVLAFRAFEKRDLMAI